MTCTQIEVCVDDNVIVNKFTEYIRRFYSCNKL